MSDFHVFYECSRCGRKHRGGAETPEAVEMVPGERKNEFVFVCAPACETVTELVDKLIPPWGVK